MLRMELAEPALAVMAGMGMSGESCYELGLMYATGANAPLDRVAAHKWFNIAVARGYRPAATMRAELAREMSPEEIAAALREARLFLTRH